MADTLDVLTLGEGRAAIGQDPDVADTDIDTELALYITATSKWVDDVAGAMVSRALVTCATNTATNTLELTSPTEKTLAEVWPGLLVSLGTAVDPWATAADREVLSVDRANFTVRIGGAAVTTTTSTQVRIGRFIDTAGVHPVVKLGASAHLRWLWAVERGAASRNFDEFGNVGETLSVPRRVLDLFADYFAPGVA